MCILFIYFFVDGRNAKKEFQTQNKPTINFERKRISLLSSSLKNNNGITFIYNRFFAQSLFYSDFNRLFLLYCFSFNFQTQQMIAAFVWVCSFSVFLMHETWHINHFISNYKNKKCYFFSMNVFFCFFVLCQNAFFRVFFSFFYEATKVKVTKLSNILQH